MPMRGWAFLKPLNAPFEVWPGRRCPYNLELDCRGETPGWWFYLIEHLSLNLPNHICPLSVALFTPVKFRSYNGHRHSSRDHGVSRTSTAEWSTAPPPSPSALRVIHVSLADIYTANAGTAPFLNLRGKSFPRDGMEKFVYTSSALLLEPFTNTKRVLI